MKTLSLTEAVQPFLDHLAQSASFRTIAGAPNSFEGWLKWELIAFLAGRNEWMARDGAIDENMLGAEWRASLRSLPNNDKTEKLIDAWFVPGPQEEQAHCLEMKVVFDNQNWKKQAISAGWDLWYLGALEEGLAKELGVLVFFGGPREGRTSTDAVSANIEDASSPIQASRYSRTLFDGCEALLYTVDWSAAHSALESDLPAKG